MSWRIYLAAIGFFAHAAASVSAAPVVSVLDTPILNELETQGYSFSEVLGGAPGGTTADLYRTNALYRSLVQTIGAPLTHNPATDQLPQIIPAGIGDIPDMVRLLRGFEDKGARSANDKKGGYYIRHLSNNSQHPYAVEADGDEPRHFDPRWLNSSYGELKLIAVVNRMDRIDFDDNSCGEIRFVYRLSYRTSKSSSSLPFFFNVVKTYPKAASCKEFAKRWVIPSAQSMTAARLKTIIFPDLTFKQIELNFQSLRFTSGYMHDFGGQAMYMQRIFRKLNDRLEPVPLENTPDVIAIERNPQMLNDFVSFLKRPGNLEKLDRGTLVINFNPQFLTKLSISWSTLGRIRSANKPFAHLFKDKKNLVTSLDISGLKYIKSHDALIERLDNLTCMGCHQSGGTAGFHMLGYADDRFSHNFNKQQLAMSPHALAEQKRRLAFITALEAGRATNDFRPHSNFPEANWTAANTQPSYSSAHLGQLCALPGSFGAAPACGPVNGQPTACVATVNSQTLPTLFGECTIKGGRASAGAVCWKGEITEGMGLPADRGPHIAYNLFAFRDKWKLKGSAYQGNELAGLRCVLPQSGAPLGRASRRCTVQEENFAALNLNNTVPAEICANQGGNGFDQCAASGNSGACLESRVVRGMLDSCSPKRQCREDYICQKLPAYHKISAAHYGNTRNGRRVNASTPDKISGTAIEALHAAQIGFCVPTYFLFNMRLDGHPSPVTGAPPGVPRFDHSKPVRGYP